MEATLYSTGAQRETFTDNTLDVDRLGLGCRRCCGFTVKMHASCVFLSLSLFFLRSYSRRQTDSLTHGISRSSSPQMHHHEGTFAVQSQKRLGWLEISVMQGWCKHMQTQTERFPKSLLAFRLQSSTIRSRCKSPRTFYSFEASTSERCWECPAQAPLRRCRCYCPSAQRESQPALKNAAASRKFRVQGQTR